MRITIFHQAVFAILFILALLIASISNGDVPHGEVWQPLHVLLLWGVLILALAAPTFRWLSLWPLILRCPRCGIVVTGFYRGLHDDGPLLLAMPCQHAFTMRGDWFMPVLRGKTKRHQCLIEELGWMVREDGCAFRPHVKFEIELLDDRGEPLARRRAKWPYWFVRWTDV